MVNLIMVGERHTSGNLQKIGPAIQKLRTGSGSVQILVEGAFLTSNERMVLLGTGKPKKPSDILFYGASDELDSGFLFKVQYAYSQRRNLKSVANASISPIESTRLRELAWTAINSLDLFQSNTVSSAISSVFESNSSSKQENFQNQIKKLDQEAAGLEAICRTWLPKNRLHTIELVLMDRLSSLMRDLQSAFTNDGALENSAKRNPNYEFTLKLLESSSFGIYDKDLSNIVKKTLSIKPARAELNSIITNLRSLIHSYYCKAWLTNGNLSSNDTLVTITGASHVPGILADLQKNIGGRLREFSPIIILTDQFLEVEKSLKDLGSLLTVKRIV
ncbi:MAG: hypothetical protein NT051_01100 [Candidatus Micrarchaeota archaeon]|nr:hypothetical protein [Candidatus Micrarchaeota archaeon]